MTTFRLPRGSLWKCLAAGVTFVTLLNTLLFSCRLSDSGCPLISSIPDNPPLFPHEQVNYQPRRTSKPTKSPQGQVDATLIEAVDKEGRKANEPAMTRQTTKSPEGEVGATLIEAVDKQRRTTNGEVTEQEFKYVPNKEMLKQGSIEDSKLTFDTKSNLIAGFPRRNQALLAIGVPTVKRRKASYLLPTVRDLIRGLDENEKEEVIIIVFITDFDPASVRSVAEELVKEFSNELESGLLRVIKAPKSYYPSLRKLPLLWGDKLDRVQWRSKQCLDYAFLFGYAKDLGQYYVQIEDDVTTSNGYLKVIKSVIDRFLNRKWSILEFGARGFIGMLYRGSELGRLSLFVKMYHWVWPVDLLYRQFNEFHLYGNPQWARHKPPLFRHVGAFSSLDGQVRRLEDMKTGYRIYNDNDNPQARVTTSIRAHARNNDIDSAYETVHHGIFWGRKIKKRDHVLIDFTKPVRILKVIVESGSANAPEDYFGGARLEFSPPSLNGECEEFTLWKEFTDQPQLNVQSTEPQGTLVKCLKIVITDLRRDRHGNVRWLVVREIAVWTHRDA